MDLHVFVLKFPMFFMLKIRVGLIFWGCHPKREGVLFFQVTPNRGVVVSRGLILGGGSYTWDFTVLLTHILIYKTSETILTCPARVIILPSRIGRNLDSIYLRASRLHR